MTSGIWNYDERISIRDRDMDIYICMTQTRTHIHGKGEGVRGEQERKGLQREAKGGEILSLQAVKVRGGASRRSAACGARGCKQNKDSQLVRRTKAESVMVRRFNICIRELTTSSWRFYLLVAWRQWSKICYCKSCYWKFRDSRAALAEPLNKTDMPKSLIGHLPTTGQAL